MSLSFIRTAIDRERPPLGDVVIVKHSRFDPSAPTQLVTTCSRCDAEFPAQFRRMGKPGTARALEVRNVPQCPSCRSRYPKKAKVAVAGERPLGPGDVVRCVEGDNYCGVEDPLTVGKLYQLVPEDESWSIFQWDQPRVQPKGYESLGPCFASRFVRAKESERRAFLGEPPLKAEDHVRIVETYGYLRDHGFTVGDRAIVAKVDGEGFVYLKPIRGEGYAIGGSFAEHFQLIEE